MAKTRTAEGKLNWETKAALGLTTLVFAACGYLGLREALEPEDGSGGEGNNPSIGLITKDIPGLDSVLSQQLETVSRISGRPDCRPQIITVSDGTNAEVAGICQVGSGETTGTFMVTRKAAGSDQQVINEQLLGYPQRDEKGNIQAIVLAYKDGSPDDGVRPLMWVYPDGLEYVFGNNMRVRFGPEEAENLGVSFADWLARAVGPEVAEAAEEEAATATVTPTPSPTLTRTPTPTKEFTPTPDNRIFVEDYYGMGRAGIREVHQSEDITAEFLANPSDLRPVFFFHQNPFIRDYGREELMSVQFLKLLSYRIDEVTMEDQSDQPPLYNAYFKVGYVDQAGGRHTFSFETRSRFGTDRDLYIIDPDTFSNRFQVGDEISVNFGFSSGGISSDKIKASIAAQYPPDQARTLRSLNVNGPFGDDPISFEEAKGLLRVDGAAVPSNKLIVETISKP